MTSQPTTTSVSESDRTDSVASASSKDLDRSLVHGIAWTSVVKWSSQMLTWVSTLIVVRFLTPADYGLVGMAGLYLGLVRILSEFGLGAAVLRFRDLSDEQVAQLNGLSILFGLAGVVASLAVAVPLGWFFDEARLPFVIVVMSSTYLISSFRIVPQALLQKDLRFRTLALIEGTHAIAAAVSTATLAVLGFGYWTLVFGGIVGSMVWVALILTRRNAPIRWPRLSAIAEAFTYSRQVLTSRLGWYGYSNSDFFIIGKVLGKGPLGVYTLGWTLAGLPVEKISALIVRVTPAFFAAVQDNLTELRRYLLLITEGLAMVTFPATVGMAVVAGDLVALALGPGWSNAVAPLRFLALAATLRSIHPLVPQLMSAIGESRATMRNSLLGLIVLPTGFYIVSRWGVAGVAAAWLVLFPLVMLPLYIRMFRRIKLSAWSYLGALWPAMSGCLVMVGGVLAMGSALPATTPVAIALAAKIGVGAIAYGAAIIGLHRRRVRMIRDVIGMLRNRRDGSSGRRTNTAERLPVATPT